MLRSYPAGVPRIRVTQVGTGRTMIGTPDELLERLGDWWTEDGSDDGAIDAHITQAVYEWECGRFDGWRNSVLGVEAAPA